MGWLTGKPKEPPKPVKCRPCNGRGWLPRFGFAPGGKLVPVDPERCSNCRGRGEV